MNDSSHTVESTSQNFRVRVESESLAKCDSSPSSDSDSPIPEISLSFKMEGVIAVSSLVQLYKRISSSVIHASSDCPHSR